MMVRSQLLILIALVLCCAHAQFLDYYIAKGVQQFALDFLQQTSDAVEPYNRDFMISPFSIWTLLVLLYEGSGGETYNQLQRVLRINVEDEKLRGVYQVWNSYLNTNTSTIEVASLQAVYTDIQSPVKSSYRDAVRNYNVQPVEVDFYSKDTVHLINEATNRTTRGLIPYTVLPQDVYGAKMFLLSSLYFKGQWTFPFNQTRTRVENFYNENGEVIGQITMMSQLGNFAYLSNVPNLDGYVLELPYGTQDTLAMVVVLPKKGTKLNNVVYNLKTIGLEPILQSLSYNKRQDNFNDNEIDVLMPKFITKTDFSLKGILGKMGITDLFDEDRANLTRMGTNLFAKLCIHSTKIIVDEKGRLTQVGLTNSRKPPTFEMNRPFLYMIVEKTSNLMLFAGQVRNPIANQ